MFNALTIYQFLLEKLVRALPRLRLGLLLRKRNITDILFNYYSAQGLSLRHNFLGLRPRILADARRIEQRLYKIVSPYFLIKMFEIFRVARRLCGTSCLASPSARSYNNDYIQFLPFFVKIITLACGLASWGKNFCAPRTAVLRCSTFQL